MAKKKKVHLPGDGERGTACGAVGSPTTDGRVTCKHCLAKVNKEFIWAAKQGKLDVMQHIVSTARDLLNSNDRDEALLNSEEDVKVAEFLFNEFSFSQDVITKTAANVFPTDRYHYREDLKDDQRAFVTYLLDKGADPSVLLKSAASTGDKTSITLMLERGANPSYGLAPAAGIGYWKVMEDLLERGADVNFGDPLSEACELVENSHYYKRERLTKDEDEEPNAERALELLLSHRPKISDAAFGSVVYKDREDLFSRLLELGANVNAMIGEGYQRRSVLHLAMQNNAIDMAIVLLKRGADPLTLPEATRELFSKLTVEQFAEIQNVISVNEVMAA